MLSSEFKFSDLIAKGDLPGHKFHGNQWVTFSKIKLKGGKTMLLQKHPNGDSRTVIIGGGRGGRGYGAGVK